MFNCLIVGVGGQGIVLASKLIAQMAINRGETVYTAETIGMAQRGGSVFSHIRIGADGFGPLIGPEGADLLIGFEPGETVRCLPFLNEGGKIVTNDQPLVPALGAMDYDGGAMVRFLREQKWECLVVAGKTLLEAAGSPKVLNVALLGAALGKGFLPFTVGEAKDVIDGHFPAHLAEINKKALDLGHREGTRRDDQ